MTITTKTAIRIGAALMLAASALNATFARAQDFTGMDITALHGDLMRGQDVMMNEQLNQIIWQNMNDPQVIALYNQQVATGQFYGSLQDFAYKFAYTGGMTVEGFGRAIGTAYDLDNRFRNDTNGYWSNQPVYQNTYNGYTGGYANIMDQYGNLLTGY